MIGTKLAVLAVVAGMLVGSAAFAADWNGLTVDSPQYSLAISESGSGSGTIRQFDENSINIAVTSGVLYSLPQITVLQADNKTFWGVCIDTHEWSTNPEGAYLKQGWVEPHALLTTLEVPAGAGRLNGTVLDQAAWNHTTYLFSQFGAGIGAMSNVEKAAFQLATWEVMSGDGNASGGNWTGGKFTATNVTGTLANDYVKAAYIGFDDNWSTALGNQSFYFSGVYNGNVAAYQDYLVYAPDPVPNIPDVPEIPAVALGPLGLMALGLLKRRFVK